MKIAVGIPFKASYNISAFTLCLKSMKRYCKLNYDLFILLDCSDGDDFPYAYILKLAESMNVKYYIRPKLGELKQAITDWVTQEVGGYDYVYFMHSDVFFFKENVLENLLEPLLNHEYIASYWETPLTVYKSTFHINRGAKKEFMVAPRCSSWCMCVDLKVYEDFISKNEVDYKLFSGHHYFLFNDSGLQKYHDWIKGQPNYEEENGDNRYEGYFIDPTTFMKYYIDAGKLKGYSFGFEPNPSFNNMDFYYRESGFVHIEQFTDDRFNDQFYSKNLFELRDQKVIEVLETQYGKDEAFDEVMKERERRLEVKR